MFILFGIFLVKHIVDKEEHQKIQMLEIVSRLPLEVVALTIQIVLQFLRFGCKLSCSG